MRRERCDTDGTVCVLDTDSERLRILALREAHAAGRLAIWCVTRVGAQRRRAMILEAAVDR